MVGELALGAAALELPLAIEVDIIQMLPDRMLLPPTPLPTVPNLLQPHPNLLPHIQILPI